MPEFSRALAHSERASDEARQTESCKAQEADGSQTSRVFQQPPDGFAGSLANREFHGYDLNVCSCLLP